jgi:Diguanylate cyclase, GGDEF domain
MSELPDEPLPPRRRAPRNGRRARFVLPAEHHDERHDERVGEVIEAFLEGPPERARHTPRTRALPRREGLRAVGRSVPMDTRNDWATALRLEDARLARYGRPASVLVIRMCVPIPGTEDRYAGRIGRIVRDHARETDRVTRAAADRFLVLLPETREAEAMLMGERLREASARRDPRQSRIDLEIRVAVSSPGSGETLQDALRTAQEAVAG